MQLIVVCNNLHYIHALGFVTRLLYLYQKFSMLLLQAIGSNRWLVRRRNDSFGESMGKPTHRKISDFSCSIWYNHEVK